MQPLRRVLLADDDVDVRSGVEELLVPLGLEVIHADSGLQALSIAQERLSQLHLMVFDLHMPGCTGLDVLNSLRCVTPREVMPPCIFYSGEATEELRLAALAAGAWAFLRKPVQPHLMRHEVLRALQHPRER